MKQWLSARLKSYSSIKGIHNQRIVIVVSDYVGHNSSVKKIQNGTQVYLVNFYADIILEFRHIGKPLLVRGIRMKIPVQVILGDMCRIITVSGTVLWFPFDRRLDMFLTIS